MKVKVERVSNSNESRQNLSLAKSSLVIYKQKNLIDKKKFQKIVFPTKFFTDDNDKNDVIQSRGIYSKTILQKYREQKKFCDITLVVGNKKFSVHRIILAVTIPYFNSMFENISIDTQEIVFHGFDAELFEIFINYAYGSKILLNEDNAENILIGASFFQLDEIINSCAKFFILNFYSSNILQCYFIANSINCELLKTKAMNYIYQNFFELAEDEGFLELSYDTVKKIVSSDMLCVENESQVFKAIIRWVKHKPEKRSQYMHSLLKFVRLFLLEPQYLINHVAKEELVTNHTECRALVEEVKNCLILPERTNTFGNLEFKPRSHNLQKRLFAVRVFLNGKNTRVRVLYLYNSFKKIWETIERINSKKQSISCVTSDKTSLYMIHVIRGEYYKINIEVYDVVSKTSQFTSTILQHRHRAGAAVLNGFLYICGGTETTSSLAIHDQSTSTVQRYCPAKNKWKLLPKMKVGRLRPAVVVCEGCLYVIGGKTTNDLTIHSMERYNPSTGKWNDFQSVEEKQEYHAASLNGKIYVIGREQKRVSGAPEINKLDVYDPKTKTWSSLASLNQDDIKSFLLNMDKLWAIGPTFVAVYDTTTNEWSFDHSIPLLQAIHYAII